MKYFIINILLYLLINVNTIYENDLTKDIEKDVQSIEHHSIIRIKPSNVVSCDCNDFSYFSPNPNKYTKNEGNLENEKSNNLSLDRHLMVPTSNLLNITPKYSSKLVFTFEEKDFLSGLKNPLETASNLQSTKETTSSVKPSKKEKYMMSYSSKLSSIMPLYMNQSILPIYSQNLFDENRKLILEDTSKSNIKNTAVNTIPLKGTSKLDTTYVIKDILEPRKEILITPRVITEPKSSTKLDNEVKWKSEINPDISALLVDNLYIRVIKSEDAFKTIPKEEMKGFDIFDNRFISIDEPKSEIETDIEKTYSSDFNAKNSSVAELEFKYRDADVNNLIPKFNSKFESVNNYSDKNGFTPRSEFDFKIMFNSDEAPVINLDGLKDTKVIQNIDNIDKNSENIKYFTPEILSNTEIGTEMTLIDDTTPEYKFTNLFTPLVNDEIEFRPVDNTISKTTSIIKNKATLKKFDEPTRKTDIMSINQFDPGKSKSIEDVFVLNFLDNEDLEHKTTTMTKPKIKIISNLKNYPISDNQNISEFRPKPKGENELFDASKTTVDSKNYITDSFQPMIEYITVSTFDHQPDNKSRLELETLTITKLSPISSYNPENIKQSIFSIQPFSNNDLYIEYDRNIVPYVNKFSSSKTKDEIFKLDYKSYTDKEIDMKNDKISTDEPNKIVKELLNELSVIFMEIIRMDEINRINNYLKKLDLGEDEEEIYENIESNEEYTNNRNGHSSKLNYQKSNVVTKKEDYKKLRFEYEELLDQLKFNFSRRETRLKICRVYFESLKQQLLKDSINSIVYSDQNIDNTANQEARIIQNVNHHQIRIKHIVEIFRIISNQYFEYLFNKLMMNAIELVFKREQLLFSRLKRYLKFPENVMMYIKKEKLVFYKNIEMTCSEKKNFLNSFIFMYISENIKGEYILDKINIKASGILEKITAIRQQLFLEIVKHHKLKQDNEREKIADWLAEINIGFKESEATDVFRKNRLTENDFYVVLTNIFIDQNQIFEKMCRTTSRLLNVAVGKYNEEKKQRDILNECSNENYGHKEDSHKITCEYK